MEDEQVPGLPIEIPQHGGLESVGKLRSVGPHVVHVRHQRRRPTKPRDVYPVRLVDEQFEMCEIELASKDPPTLTGTIRGNSWFPRQFVYPVTCGERWIGQRPNDLILAEPCELFSAK